MCHQPHKHSLCPSRGWTHSAGVAGCSAPAQAAPGKEIEAELTLGSNTSQSCWSQQSHNVPACAQTQPLGTPLCQHLPPASPQSPLLLSLLALGTEPSAHSPSTGASGLGLEGLCWGDKEPEGPLFRDSPGRRWQRAAPSCPSPGALGARTTMLRRATLGRKPHLSLFCLSIRVRSLTLSMTKIKLHFSGPGSGSAGGSPSPGPCGCSPHHPRGVNAPAWTPPLPGFMETFIRDKTPFSPFRCHPAALRAFLLVWKTKSASQGCAADSRGYI